MAQQLDYVFHKCDDAGSVLNAWHANSHGLELECQEAQQQKIFGVKVVFILIPMYVREVCSCFGLLLLG